MSVDTNAPEVQEAIKAATEALANKNRELLAELKEAKRGKAINPDDVAKLEELLDAANAKAAKLENDYKALAKASEQSAKALQSEQAYTQSLLIDNGLTDALTKVGVTNPAHVEVLRSHLSKSAQVVLDGENRVARIGDKPLHDYVKDWAASDAGKAFVTAPINSGGGATGSNGGAAGQKTLKREAFDALNPAEKAGHIKTGGAVTD
jgi:hypothetical protein